MAATFESSQLFQGCRNRQEFDVIIKVAHIFNGLKEKEFEAEVAIAGDSIVAVGQCEERRAKKIIGGRGLVLAPGFIDIHDHTDIQLLINPRAENHAHQGSTTIVSGNCGSSPFPLLGLALRQFYGLDLSWHDINGFLSLLEKEVFPGRILKRV